MTRRSLFQLLCVIVSLSFLGCDESQHRHDLEAFHQFQDIHGATNAHFASLTFEEWNQIRKKKKDGGIDGEAFWFGYAMTKSVLRK